MKSMDLAQIYARNDKNRVYLRTDKNGTEIWADYTCPRCGGAGGADAWTYTGWTCYSCGGTGRRDKPQLIKYYTPEYRAKLDERTRKRAEKKRLERVAELKANLTEHMKEKGFNESGKMYVTIGNTYEIKDQLREAGAKWEPRFRSWVFSEKPEEFDTIELSFDEVCEVNEMAGQIEYKDIDFISLIESKLPAPEIVSEYVGEKGKRLEFKATLEDWRSWEVPSYSGWGTDTKVLYKFRDESGNILIWCTTGYGVDSKIKKGDKIILRGTVKNHSEYKGEKQTELQRCTVKVA